MHKRLIAALLLLLLSLNICAATKPEQYVQIADPYIEMHTGAGSGFPVFHVMERGDFIQIVYQRSSWFKVRNKKGLEGWVPLEQMAKTLAPNGEPVTFAEITQDNFIERNWEWGVLGGDFAGAPIFTLYGSYLINQSFATEASYSKSITDTSSSTLWKVGILMQPFPEWEYTPYFFMGTGIIDVKPSATSIQSTDLNNQFANISFGIRTHLTQKIIIRLEYSDYVIFNATNSNDNNGDVKEWKAGFAVFF